MSDGKKDLAELELLFVDEGRYHTAEVELPTELLDGYERLIDCLLEEPEVLRRLHVDRARLCAAYRKG
jgi:hypothetical protein